MSVSSITTTTSNLLSSAESTVDSTLKKLSNNYVSTLLLVVLIAYAPLAAPKLHPHLVGILGNYAVKFVWLFLLAYLLSKNVRVSVLVGLVVVLTAIILKKLHLEGFDAKKVVLKGADLVEGKPEFHLTNDALNPLHKLRRKGEVVPEKPEELEHPIGFEGKHQNAAPADHSETLHAAPVVLVQKKDVAAPKDIDNCAGVESEDYTGYDEFVEGNDGNEKFSSL
jgi:hypothetical protein